jgi:hypothetical protein
MTPLNPVTECGESSAGVISDAVRKFRRSQNPSHSPASALLVDSGISVSIAVPVRKVEIPLGLSPPYLRRPCASHVICRTGVLAGTSIRETSRVFRPANDRGWPGGRLVKTRQITVDYFPALSVRNRDLDPLRSEQVIQLTVPPVASTVIPRTSVSQSSVCRRWGWTLHRVYQGDRRAVDGSDNGGFLVCKSGGES